MNDAARVIVLDQDVRFETSDWPQQPYTLAHNVTVTSDRNGPHRVIDFNAREVTNRLLIAPGVNMSLIHVTLKDTRYGAGADLDILAPGSGGLIYFHDLAKLQTSCPPLIEANVLAYQRDPLVPGVNNVTFPKVVVWDGVTYHDNILYSNFSTRVAGGENQPGSGYTVQKWGSYKLCKSVPGPACVAANDVSTCVKMEQDADYFANHYVPPPRSGLSPAAKGGIGAAAGVVVALATAAAALALARRRRRAAARRVGGGEVVKGLDLSDVESGFGSGLGSDGVARKGRLGQHASGATTGGVVHVLCPTNPSPSSSGGALQGGPGSGSSQLDRPGGGSRSSVSSQLPDVLSGSLTREEASAVQLGTLVGAGSFGRVFRGHFGDVEVAIKVIHHNRQAAVRVANEVQLMMGFDNENVVKAHHFVTWGAAGVSRPEGNGVADARHISFNGSFTVPFFDVASSSGGNSLVASGNGSGGTLAAAASKRMVETWILQEYCDGGTLQDAVFEKGSGAFFNTQMVPQMGVMLHMLLGVSRGMEWLHARNVLHGDLKAANVLLKSPDGGRGAAARFSGSHSGAASQGLGGGPGVAEAARAAVAESVLAMVPKVADFGLSRIMGEGATHLSTHTLGTITHQCPELIRTGRLSKPADAFSFGVVMWEVIMAANPWGGKMMGEIVTAVMEGRRLTFGPAAPHAYVELAKDCMRGVSERRPTFDQIVARLQAMLAQQDELQAEAEAGAANAAAAAAAQETPVAEDGWRRVA